NFHSGAEVLNFPWDRGENLWDGRIHADSSWFFKISKRYADTVHIYSSPTTYLTDLYSAESYPGVTRGDDWYEVNGSRQDYVNYQQACREVTMEISASKQSPASDLPILWDYNERSLMLYLSEAFYGIHGVVRDNNSEEPLEAMITVVSHDRDSSQVFSDSLVGYFSRLIDKGSWDLKVSAPGYHTAYISNITTEEYKQRFLDIRLSKDTSAIPIVRPNNLLIWPVPASEYINIKLPPGFGTDLNITIVSSSGKVVYRKDHTLLGEYLNNIHVRNFAAGLYIVKVRNRGGQVIISNIIIR
ncbi:MAG: T9SS type A sorting domain-containing protein, partial [Bacteroidales bacterium]|nr:T9SS type A sorting domain-containing protein [Bacteroidales bacterium]